MFQLSYELVQWAEMCEEAQAHAALEEELRTQTKEQNDE